MKKKCLLFCLFIILIPGYIFADHVRISQIDSSGLLLSQEVKLYVSVTSDLGKPVTGLNADKFSIYESSDNKKFKEVSNVSGFDVMANYESGINFLLLVDNSGSMYRTLSGKKPRREADMRISHAKRALVTFLKSVSNPKDKIGLAAYNTNYTSYSELTNDRVKIQGYLDEIVRPGKGDRYSEIYSSVYLAVDEFKSVKGRKAIIVLSDGRNQSYFKYTKKPHDVFGEKIYKYTEPMEYCQLEGISVYAVNFGPKRAKKDKGLSRIAYETGGTVFDAHDQNQLKEVYSKIVNQILNEYLITYEATMEPADKKFVKIDYKTPLGMLSAVRFYFSSTVFGNPMKHFNFLLILPLLLAIALLWLLTKLKFENKQTDPSLEVLNAGSAKASTNFFTLDKSKKTVIGGDSGADMTLSGGATKIKEKHATVAFDAKNKGYTIVADGNLTVNNKPVKTKLLEPGDVINVGGTTIVFDDGEFD